MSRDTVREVLDALFAFVVVISVFMVVHAMTLAYHSPTKREYYLVQGRCSLVTVFSPYMRIKVVEAPKPQEPVNVSRGSSSVYSDITYASQKYGVPFELLLAQAEVESDLDPTKTGSKGDIGLFQILPSTSESINKMYFNVPSFTPGMLYNPSLNAQFAASYLKYLYSSTHDWYTALASYNMGECGYRRFVSYYGYIDTPYVAKIKLAHMKLIR